MKVLTSAVERSAISDDLTFPNSTESALCVEEIIMTESTIRLLPLASTSESGCVCCSPYQENVQEGVPRGSSTRTVSSDLPVDPAALQSAVEEAGYRLADA